MQERQVHTYAIRSRILPDSQDTLAGLDLFFFFLVSLYLLQKKS